VNAVPEPRPWLRAMTLQDLDAVLAIEARSYGWPWSRGNFIDALAAGYIAEILEDRDAGMLGYFVAMTGVDELHLLNVTVAPEWRGRGHGSALLDAVVAHGRGRGLATLWLEVRQGNGRARSLYARRGFAEVGLRRGYYPAHERREDAVVMRLALRGEDPHAVD
jgi:ribosomal-protein-alanine N-acetyltransferase